MAVTNIRLSKLGSSSESTGTDTGAVSLTYNANFIVTCDSSLDQGPIIHEYLRTHTTFGTTPLPWHGRTFNYGNGFDTSSVCRSVQVDYLENSAGLHSLRARYEPISGPGSDDPKTVGLDGSGKKTEDPLKFHQTIDVSWTPVSVPMEKALFLGFNPPGIVNPFLKPGTTGPVVNSAIVPFDPTLESTLYIKVIRLGRNVPQYLGTLYDTFNGSVNSALSVISRPVFGFQQSIPKHGGKVLIGASLGEENGKFFWHQTAEVQIHPRTWVREVVDRGVTRRRAFGDPKDGGGTISTDDLEHGVFHEPIKDAEDFPITEPILLNGNGQPLEPGKPAVFLKYLDDPLREWAPLGIYW